MAVDQDLLDQIAGSVADLYREVETALITAVAQRLRADLPLPSPFEETKLDAIRKLQQSARLILATLQATRARVIRDAIARAYRSGGDAAVADLPADWFPRSGIGQQARDALREIPNARVIENIAAALHRDVGRVDQNILRAPVDAYRAVQAGAAARITSGAFTRRQASQAAWQRLMDRGIVDFTDRAGRRWKLSSYVEMLARTNAQRAAVQGQTDRLESIGIDLVYISDNSQECKRCRPFESKVLARGSGPIGKIQIKHATKDGVMVTVDVLDTLAGAMSRGLFHPNCRHSASAYLPGVTVLKKGTADPEGDKARQRQRALERKIRAEKEKVLGALTPEAKKEANARVRAAQAALRAHLAAHPKLKRLPYREQIGAGNIPKQGGPKGGPVQDLQPPIQDALPLGAPDAGIPARPAPAKPAAPNPAQAEQKTKTEAAKPAQPPAQAEQTKLTPAKQPKAKAKGESPQQPSLAERVALGERSREELSGGMGGDTSLVTLADGSKVIHKVARRTHIGDDAVEQVDAEELGGKVARALGLQAPRVHRVGPIEMYQEYMPGTLAAKAKKPKGYLTSDDGWRMALLDALLDYPDRHTGNWLVHRGRLVSIDHGLAFSFWNEEAMSEAVGKPIVHDVGKFWPMMMRKSETPNFFRIGEWVDNDLSRHDIETARARLTALRGDFQALGRDDWWRAMMARLDGIEPHAKGTSRRLA
ncbi:phage minor capsid protein [Nonomuraea sp. NPDC003560]|uniref:phage minor capsid protein n=1 Tax=Nonomuraea sp. NPDC003560 TaxID=3364341 RepID=UPI0036CC49E4